LRDKKLEVKKKDTIFNKMKKYIFISLFSLSLVFCTKTNAQADMRTSIGVKNVKYFPNPATTIINFDFSDKIDLKNATFKISSLIGKTMFETSNLTPRTVINLNDFFRGVYIFQVTDRNGKLLESSKFVVQK
jgi:hypothetical protein